MEFFIKRAVSFRADIFSGLTVALALIPEAVAFAFVAGIDPLVGLYAAFMVGLITSLFGGRPGMISGATGALAVVMVSLVTEGNAKGVQGDDMGLYFLFATVILMGIIQILAGLFKLGKLIRLIPHPVMMGFVNGLAIVIFLSQIGMFKTVAKKENGTPIWVTESTTKKFEIKDNQYFDVDTKQPLYYVFVNGQVVDFYTAQPTFKIEKNQLIDLETGDPKFNIEEDGIYQIKKIGKKKIFLPQKKLYTMIILVVFTMLLMWGLSKISSKIPSALMAIIIVSTITILGDLEVATVGSFIREGGGEGLKGGLPTFQWELFSKLPFSLETLKFIGPYALILAAVGLIESLMTLNLIDEITETRGKSNKECMAQGASNIITGFFGGMGGCAMIGQSLINIKSGGRTRISGIVAAITLLMFILFASELIEQIPIAVLVGVMFMVVIGTFAWSSFRVLNKIPRKDAVVLILVSALTVIFDLAIAVISGVIVSALVFSWENAKNIRARESMKGGVKVYEIWGPLFFGSIQGFNSKFNPAQDPEEIEVDFLESKVLDFSAVEALKKLIERYEKVEKKIHLKHLSPDCKQILRKMSSSKLDDVIVDSVDDPRYYVMMQESV